MLKTANLEINQLVKNTWCRVIKRPQNAVYQNKQGRLLAHYLQEENVFSVFS